MNFTGIFNSNVSRNKQIQTMIKHVPFNKSIYNPPTINLINNRSVLSQIKNGLPLKNIDGKETRDRRYAWQFQKICFNYIQINRMNTWRICR